MPFKTILVCLTTERAAERIMPTACAIAEAHGAHLVGLHTIEAIVPYPGIAMHIDHPRFDDFNEEVEAENARICAIFEAALEGAGVEGEWRSMQAQSTQASDALEQAAFRADLVIASQPDPQHERRHQLGVQEDLIVNSGRPVLLVPEEQGDRAVGKRILLAWNATREAASAVQGALPFLTEAEEVVILTVSAPRPHSIADEEEGHELAVQLARHGARTTVRHVEQTEDSVGEQIVRQARVDGCDLIVMGAFGHSRLHSFFFGDATRFMLASADLPVLYAS